MAEFKKLTYVDGSLWFNGQLVATVSDEWIRGNIQTIKNILEVSSGGPGVAADVSYDNTISQILATNVQTAIDEIHEEIDDRAGACEGRLDVVEDNIEGLVDTINIEVIPEELGDTVGDAISSINDSLKNKANNTWKHHQTVSGTTRIDIPSTANEILIKTNTPYYNYTEVIPSGVYCAHSILGTTANNVMVNITPTYCQIENAKQDSSDNTANATLALFYR